MKLKSMNVLDAGLLLMESPQTPMHIGGIQVIKLPRGAGPDFVHKLRQRMMRFAADGAPFNYRLARSGGALGALKWEVLDEVNLDEHVFHHALPYPGGERELLELISRLNGGPLERSRPLWEQHLIEGLAGGRYATFTRIHHALMDGQWGIKLAHATTSPDPGARGLPPYWAVKFDGDKAVAPGAVKAVGAAVKAAAKAAQAATKAAGQTGAISPGWWERQTHEIQANLETMAQLRTAFGRLIDSYRDPADDGLVPMYTAPATMLNGRLTAQRALALARLDLERIRRIAQQREVKINDVVMALCGGALRRYLAERNALPAKPLIASMPVAMARTDGDAAGNAIVTGMVSLATHLADPLQRLATVHGSSAHAKELIRGLASQTALTIYMTVTGLPYILAQLAGQAERVLVHNLVLSNVHGVSERRYINGALIEAEYPISLLVPGQAMNITVISHADQLDVAVLVCPSLVPQPQRVADAMCEELDVLERACRGRRGRGVAAKSAKAAAGRAAKPSPAARQVARPKRGART
jgi:diacylglycerol O-acyltransferase